MRVLGFRDRRDAGRRLAQQLEMFRGRDDVVVLALPRGGVPVAYEVATALGAPLDVFLVRKLGTPGHEELAMGALASGGVVVVNEDVVGNLAIPRAAIADVVERERRELARRDREYRDERPATVLAGRLVILVDDGLATGSTMRAAIEAVRASEPAQIVVAVPTAPKVTCDDLRREVDEVVCLSSPSPFFAVGSAYDDFTQTSDDEVRELLRLSAREGS